MKEVILKSLEDNSEKVFLYEKENEWTYGELKKFVSAFSYYIKENQVKRIVITLPEEFYAYGIILTCYLTGTIYCVNNKDNPLARRLSLYSQMDADLIISDIDELKNSIKLSDLINEIARFSNLKDIYIKNHPIMYVSFTSGSTGNPKGCKIRTEAVEKHLMNDLDVFGFTTEDVMGQYVPLHFDMSVLDLYGAVLVGASLVSFGESDKMRPEKLIKKHRITFLNIVPQVLDIMIKSGSLTYDTISSVRMIRFGGDKVYKSKAELLFSIKPELLLVSTYGPTETTMFTTYCKINKDNLNDMSTTILSMGAPIKGSEIVLYNETEGIGEIVILGDYIGEGYLGEYQGGYKIIRQGDSAINAYFTGDYAKKIGEIFFFEGRKDQQIKKNGNRVSLVEIETAITKCSKTECAAVFAKNMIICYLERGCMINENINTSEIMECLKNVLPAYALPNKLFFVDEIPHNANGKKDYKKIKDMVC